jgi:hypothetical protein
MAAAEAVSRGILPALANFAAWRKMQETRNSLENNELWRKINFGARIASH